MSRVMENKPKNSANIKGYVLPNTTMTKADVIPTTITSIPPVILPLPPSLTKDDAGFNKYQSHQYRSTRQRTNNANLLQNINTATETPYSQLTQQHSIAMQKNKTMSNESLMNTKAAACIASPVDQLAAVHAKATSSRNKNEEAINDLKMRIPEIENIFDIHGRIGNGTFSTVLLGTLKKQRNVPENLKRQFAIKHHIPTGHPDRIMKELQCMAKIGGTDNVVAINCCIRCNESVAFIMPYLAHDRFHDFYNKMDLAEVKFYMKNLLIALRHVHHFNVIHRDVKPSNFLYNRRKRQFLLVDFGLAQQMPASHISLTNNNNNNVPKKTEILLPPSSANKTIPSGGEGKRSRENDDTIASKSPEGAIAVTGAGGIVSGTAKRLRCVAPIVESHTLEAVTTDSTARAANAPNTGSKGAADSRSSNASVIERKSTGAANIHNMSSRLQQKLRVQGGAESVQHSSARTSSAGCGKNTSSITQTANANNNNTIEGKYNTNRNLSTSNSPKCYCYGKHQVCNICLVKKEIHASRAGTPGYRPPEVLLKYPDQTTAVDVWAAGVIFLSVLSSVYPFFKAPNDYVALAEMITIFGDKIIRKTAYALDRLVTLSQKTKPLDLRKLSVRFRNRAKFSSPELLRKHQRVDGTCEVCKNCDQFFFNCLCLESNFVTESLDDDDVFPASAYDLLYRLLEINPHKRITADEALRHPFFLESDNNNDNITTSTSTSSPVTTTAPTTTSAVPLNKISAKKII